VRLRLPYPPSVNDYYRRTRRGVFLNARAVAYRTAVQLAVYPHRDRTWPLCRALHVEIDVYQPVKVRKRDLDNILKATLDALQHSGVFVDDCQIVDLHLRAREPLVQGHLDVTLTEL
jgi:crossover junction endodeoxyribonuclease RusA